MITALSRVAIIAGTVALLVILDQQALAVWAIFIGAGLTLLVPLEHGPRLRLRLVYRPRRRAPARRRRSTRK